MPLCTYDNGRLEFNFHEGQNRIMESRKRFVIGLAGTQGGKSSAGPPWLLREIQEKGPGDYLVVTPTYPLLSLKALPEFLNLFRRILQFGEYKAQERVFQFSEYGQTILFGKVEETPTKVFFGHASDPESLEAATAKAAWCDEAGQKKFRLGSWEAILRRLAVHQGRVLITTTPYDLGWLKLKLSDPWERTNHNHPSIDVIRWESRLNPAFPREEWERAEMDLPRWKFDLFYRAIFTRPAGMIYDCFEEGVHLIPRFALPASWPRYLGLDFGGVNTVGIFVAEELGNDRLPTGRFFAYREYRAGGRIAAEHCRALIEGETQLPLAVGGAGSEDQWREEFAAGGLPVQRPWVKKTATKTSVEVGIDRVYGALKHKEILFFEDLENTIADLQSYARELDDLGNPTKEIESKEDFHHADAVRYLLSYLKGGRNDWSFGTSDERESFFGSIPRGVLAYDGRKEEDE